VAALVYPLGRSLERTETPSLLWLILATLPLGIDFALGYFSIWENTHLSVFDRRLLSSVASSISARIDRFEFCDCPSI